MPRGGTESAHNHDHDVVIVGGGPAGCSAGVFCSREGLDTVIFDRGNSSIRQCAHLENYLGFPAGIDIDTFYALMHDHAEAAGCEIISDMVESIEHTVEGQGFRIVLQDGDPVTARRVVAATRYDGEYMRGLGDDSAMFETFRHDGEDHTRFDTEYAKHDGATPVPGLYVASPSDEADTQAIMAAGRGARVAWRVIADVRKADDWWEEVADGEDWVRREAELDDEETGRERWVEWFNDYHDRNAPVDSESDRFHRVREEYIEHSLASYITRDEIETRTVDGHRAIARHLDVDAIVDAVDETDLLNALDEETVREYLESNDEISTTNN